MAALGHITLWLLAIVGSLTVLCVVGAIVNNWLTNDGTEEVVPQRPPVQITNLRTIPEPAPKVDPNQPQVLQKTTMEITTTKYVDPNAKPPKEISA